MTTPIRLTQLPGSIRALLARLFDRSTAEQRAAAARYWAAVGHDMPLEDRAPRLRQLAQGAPGIKIHHRPHLTR
jgi:hypothetical protein